jgi:chromosome segregation ATPase
MDIQVNPLNHSDVFELRNEITRAVGEALAQEQAQRKQINELHKALSKEVAARRAASAARDSANEALLRSIDTTIRALSMNDKLMSELTRLRAALSSAEERIRQLTSTPQGVSPGNGEFQ